MELEQIILTFESAKDKIMEQISKAAEDKQQSLREQVRQLEIKINEFKEINKKQQKQVTILNNMCENLDKMTETLDNDVLDIDDYTKQSSAVKTDLIDFMETL